MEQTTETTTTVTKTTVSETTMDETAEQTLYSEIEIFLSGKKNLTQVQEWAFTDTDTMLDFDKLVPIDERPITYPFELDAFQKRGVYRVTRNENVFVAAHTSAGKTVIAEWAVAQALKQGRRAIYTCPIKALSNQKFRDLRQKLKKSDGGIETNRKTHTNYYDEEGDEDLYYFEENTRGQDDDDDAMVGIITGDVQLNTGAPCLVMTTEILRSMIYKDDPYLREVDWIIFDEIHYMNDAERGRVWEEVIQLAPDNIHMVFLSATTPNSFEFSQWVGEKRQSPVYITTTPTRPVPIEHYINTGTTTVSNYYEVIKPPSDESGSDEEGHNSFQDSDTEEDDFSAFDNLFGATSILGDELLNTDTTVVKKKGPVRTRLKPDIVMDLEEEDGFFKIVNERENYLKDNFTQAVKTLATKREIKNKDNRLKRVSYQAKSYLLLNLIKILEIKEKLPVIFFVFSRKGCEQYCERIPTIDLVSKRAKSRIHTFIQKALKKIPEEDRTLPQIEFVTGLVKRGIGIHHSGLLPILKEIVEILFHKGLIQILFATETFAMGVNMPARTVAFLGLKKHDGTSFRSILAGEYTQMSGRAGRRGFDGVGTVIVTAFEEVPNLKKMATGKPLTLQSKFRLTYQTILSILKLSGRDLSVTDMMRSSFGEFNKTYNTAERQQGSRLLHLTQQKYQETITKSTLSPTDIEKLDTLITKMKKVAVISRTLSPKIWSQRKYQKLLKVGRILLVIPEKGGLFPIVMTVAALKNTRGENWLSCRHLNGQEEDIRGSWIMGITNSFIQDKKSYPKMGIISFGKKITLNLTDMMDYNTTRTILDSLLLTNLEWGTGVTISSTEIELSHERVWLQENCNNISNQLSDDSLRLMPDYTNRLAILQDLEYIDSEEIVLTKGNVCREINTCNELLLTEFIMSGYLESLQASEVAAVLSMLINNGRNAKIAAEVAAIDKLNPKVAKAVTQMYEILHRILEIQVTHNLDFDPEKYRTSISPSMIITVLKWCEGETFHQICQYSDIMEGTIVRNMLRLDEVILEVGKIGELIGNNEMVTKMTEASSLVKRSIVYTSSLYI